MELTTQGEIMLEDICMAAYNKKHAKRHNKIDKLVDEISGAFPKAFIEVEKFMRNFPDSFVLCNKVYFHVVVGSKPEDVTEKSELTVRTIQNGNEYYFKILAKTKLYDYLRDYYFEAINVRNRLMKAFSEELQRHTSMKIELASGDYTYEFSYYIRVRELVK
jgi:hypothetical protein